MYNKSYDKFWIKEHHIILFYEFIAELDKIPDSASKVAFLRRHLYHSFKKTPFRIIVKYFADRILYEETPKVRILPLSTEGNSNESYFKINLPQIDLVLTKGINIERFRQGIEDFIYSTKGIIQKFLCDYANGENIFKIPKTDLKDCISVKKLVLDSCKVLDVKELSTEFIGYDKDYFYNYKYLPQEYYEKRKGRLLPTEGDLETYRKKHWRQHFKERRDKMAKGYLRGIEKGYDNSYRYGFPAIVFHQKEEVAPIYYFIKHSGLIRTNMEGLMRHWFVFMTKSSIREFIPKSFVFIAYYRNEEFQVMACNTDWSQSKTILENRTNRLSCSPTTHMKNFEGFMKNVEVRLKMYKVKKTIKISRRNGTPIMDLHTLLNYLLLYRNKHTDNIVVMFANSVIITPKFNVQKVVVLSYDPFKKKLLVKALDEEQKEYNLHHTRISQSTSNITHYIGKTAHLFHFEIGGDFILLESLKDLTWETQIYEKNAQHILTF